MRNRLLISLSVCVLGLGMVAMGPPAGLNGGSVGENTAQAAQYKRLLTPNRFRCILVGDSQTTGPSSNRIRTQAHRWNAPIVGELITVGNASAGLVVNNGTGRVDGLSYSNISLDAGWPDGGSPDFFAVLGSQWQCNGDIESPGSLIGRYRLRFYGGNVDSPWNEPWGIGNPLIAKIAVRTSPRSVGAVQTRAERGGVFSASARTVHTLNQTDGIQIIEQLIPADFQTDGDDVGVGIFLPSGSVELPGEVLQILGVLIERVDEQGQSLPGTIVGYQGTGGWAIDDHLEKISPASRAALIEMINPEYVMIMLGHNRETNREKGILPNMVQLVQEWEATFAATGRPRPSVIYVTPWAISTPLATDYMKHVESVMGMLAASNWQDMHINFLSRFNDLRPDVYDPKRYQLDNPLVHPGDVPTAINLSEDLYQMLFHPGQSWYRSRSPRKSR